MGDKFTPGPWKVERAQRQTDFDETTVCFVNYGDGQPLFVSSASDTHGDAEATAKLIAAAPDMLAALKLVASSISTLDPCYMALVVAINKATL